MSYTLHWWILCFLVRLSLDCNLTRTELSNFGPLFAQNLETCKKMGWAGLPAGSRDAMSGGQKPSWMNHDSAAVPAWNFKFFCKILCVQGIQSLEFFFATSAFVTDPFFSMFLRLWNCKERENSFRSRDWSCLEQNERLRIKDWSTNCLEGTKMSHSLLQPGQDIWKSFLIYFDNFLVEIRTLISNVQTQSIIYLQTRGKFAMANC